MKNRSSRLNIRDCWITMPIADFKSVCFVAMVYMTLLCQALGKRCELIKKQSSISRGRAVVVALNLLKSVFFIFTTLGSAVCTFCFVAGVTKLFFLRVSEKFQVHRKRLEKTKYFYQYLLTPGIDSENLCSLSLNFTFVPAFQLFATAQKMKFSIKNFFSKCDQILNGKLYFLCIVHCFNIYHDSMVQQQNSQSPPQKSSFKAKVYPPPSWGHIVTQAPRQSIIFMLQLLTLFPFKNI